MTPSPSPFRVRSLALVVAAALALSACGSLRPAAATVGGVDISDDQLKENVRFFEFLSSLGGQPCGQAVLNETEQSACARSTLSILIQEELVKIYAGKNGVSVSDSEVLDEIDQLTSSFGGQGQLDARLKQGGLTSNEFRALVKRLLLFQDVARAIGSEQITDDQLRQTYEDNKAQYTQLHAEHILLKTEDQANAIEKKVTAANFEELARKYSIDPSAAQNGGDLGTVSAAQFDATFVQAALALKPGEISEPVQTQFGWHVIRLISADVTPFDEVRTQLLDQASGLSLQDWFKHELQAVDISVNPKYGRFDASTGRIDPIRSTATGSPAAGQAASSAP